MEEKDPRRPLNDHEDGVGVFKEGDELELPFDAGLHRHPVRVHVRISFAGSRPAEEVGFPAVGEKLNHVFYFYSSDTDSFRCFRRLLSLSILQELFSAGRF